MSGTQATEPITYRYTFRFSDGAEKRFEVRLDPATLALISSTEPAKPHWTKLGYHQCEQCPLKESATHCPVAVNLANLVESFKDTLSHEEISVTVETAQRSYSKQTSLQQGLSSIIGIYMVTSNCPVMDKLRPNVRFHLPFASSGETVYRAVSVYLMAQYFRMKRGEVPDWTLEHLSEIYKLVWLVNKGMSQRLSHASAQDANVNAVIVLSTFGSTLDNYLEECLAEFTPLFAPPSVEPDKQ
jgi:hypothetical protein